MWAETIVRAHKKCNLGMLQRLLQIDNATASALKSELLKNGVISTHANAYGMHSAVKPLYEGAFLRPTSEIDTLKNTVNSTTEHGTENSLKIKELDKEPESVFDQVESDSEAIESISEEEISPLEDHDNPATLANEETESEQEFHERTSR